MLFAPGPPNPPPAPQMHNHSVFPAADLLLCTSSGNEETCWIWRNLNYDKWEDLSHLSCTLSFAVKEANNSRKMPESYSFQTNRLHFAIPQLHSGRVTRSLATSKWQFQDGAGCLLSNRVISISKSNFIWCTLSAHRPAWLLLSEYPVSSLFKLLRTKSRGFDYKVFALGFPNECSRAAEILFCCLHQNDINIESGRQEDSRCRYL